MGVPEASVTGEANCCQMIAPANTRRNADDAMSSPARPARPSSRTCGSISSVQPATGFEPGERSMIAKTSVLQKARCTAIEIPEETALPMISPTGAPASACARAIAPTAMGSTIVRSIVSRRFHVRK
jgi:hypothetical protein